MAEKNYMVVDGRRDHSFRIPRPDLSESNSALPMLVTTVTLSLKSRLPGRRKPYASGTEKNAPTIRTMAKPSLWLNVAIPAGEDLLKRLLRQLDTPDIVRATAVELLANYRSSDLIKLTQDAIEDASPLVRAAGLRVLRGNTATSFVLKAAELLQDSVRIVRMAAAQRLVGEASQLLEPPYRGYLDDAVREYRNGQQLMSERAATHLNLAALSHALGNVQATQESLRVAIKLEPYLSGVRDQLATLLQQSGGDPVEVRKLREEEVKLLRRDYDLLPDSDHPRYQRGMLLYLLQRHAEARAAIEEACRLGPNGYNNWLALALICEKQQRWQQAVDALKEMNRIRPEDQAAREIFQRIQQAMSEQQ